MSPIQVHSFFSVTAHLAWSTVDGNQYSLANSTFCTFSTYNPQENVFSMGAPTPAPRGTWTDRIRTVYTFCWPQVEWQPGCHVSTARSSCNSTATSESYRSVKSTEALSRVIYSDCVYLIRKIVIVLYDLILIRGGAENAVSNKKPDKVYPLYNNHKHTHTNLEVHVISVDYD